MESTNVFGTKIFVPCGWNWRLIIVGTGRDLSDTPHDNAHAGIHNAHNDYAEARQRPTVAPNGAHKLIRGARMG